MSANVTLEELRRAQIVDAAVRTISSNGSANVTMDDIARASGLSKGGVAHYFSSKDELFKEAFKYFFDRIFQRSKETMDGFDDPEEKLLSFSWRYSWDDPDVNVGYPLLYECMALSVHSDEYLQLFQEWIDRWVSMLGDAIIEGNHTGKFHIDEPEEAAQAISAIYHGIATRWYLGRRNHSREWAIKSFTRAIKLFLYGEGEETRGK